MTHRKQTLLSFIGLLFVVAVIKLSGDYRYVTKRESEYRSGYNVISADCVEYRDGKRDTLTWQILKRK